jgi:uncharacterized protein
LNRNLFALLFIVISFQAGADFRAGGEAYERGDYETAAKEFLPLAEKGDHRAMYALGSMYAAGQGVPPDLKEAFKWFQKAARYGRPDAEYKIGLMYASGQGVDQDYRKALHWFGKSAKKGYGLSQYHIGLMYSEGLGVPQSDIKAYAWLEAALSQGITEVRDSLQSLQTRLTPEQLEEAKALSREYRQTERLH